MLSHVSKAAAASNLSGAESFNASRQFLGGCPEMIDFVAIEAAFFHEDEFDIVASKSDGFPSLFRGERERSHC